jgi:hypothetical protein
MSTVAHTTPRDAVERDALFRQFMTWRAQQRR